jgi:hypothetical protein
MSTTTAILLTIVLMSNCVVTEEKLDFRVIVKMFADRDLTSIQSIRPQSIEDLALDQRNQVALAAAKSLSVKKYIEAIGDDSIYKHFTKPSTQESPAETECRKQLGINRSSASLLQHLAEKRMINDPGILPYLIEALDHPDRHWVGQKCFYALKYLTRQESGDIYWARLVSDEKKHAEIHKWWQDWWQRNREKHPIFDADLETLARREVLRLARSIDENLKPRFPELKLFQVPETLPLRWQRPLFYVEYDPGNWSLLPNSFDGINSKRLPWILISCRFQSKGLKDTWAREDKLQPTERLRDRMKTCYSKTIQGSDLLVEIMAASENETLMKAMDSAFDQTPDTQNRGARDGVPAARAP